MVALRDDPLFDCPGDCVMKSQPGAGDRSGSRPTISHKYVAIHHDRVLSERAQVNCAAQTTPNQTRNLMGASPNFSFHRLALVTLIG